MNTKAHILVIRLSAMGDVAMTVPVLLTLARHYPELKITVLTRRFFAPMFAQLPNVNVFEADVKGAHKGLKGLYTLHKSLKKLGIDAVADLHDVLRSNVLKALFRLDGKPFYQIDKGRNQKKALTAATNKRFEQLKTTHQRYADVLARMGYPVALNKEAFLNKEMPTKNLLEFFKPRNKKMIGIAPFAAFEGKTYPMVQMATIIEALVGHIDYTIFLFGGGPQEDKLLSQFADEHHCINTIGKFDFADELALISNLDLMLAMDSGNGHLAAMYGVPTVTLWGITHPYAGFVPFKQEANVLLADRQKFPLIPTSVYGNKMPSGYDKAIASISPVTVIDKINELLTV